MFGGSENAQGAKLKMRYLAKESAATDSYAPCKQTSGQERLKTEAFARLRMKGRSFSAA